MDTLGKIMLVGTGGFLGSNARYWLGGWIQSRLGPDFPWQTMFINVSGSLLIGFILGMLSNAGGQPNWRLFLAIGVMGGYTTYSSFAYEAVNLISLRQYGWALFYIQGTAIVTVFAAWAGLVLSRVASGGRT